jgi:nicotinamidase-related amidase
MIPQKAKNVLSYFRKEEMPVIHVQHIALQEGATFFYPIQKVLKHKSMTPLKTEKVITKNFPNSFRDTELLDYLKENNISKLVICGMMTDVCVVHNTSSYGYGFENTIITDAVTTKTEFNGKVLT